MRLPKVEQRTQADLSRPFLASRQTNDDGTPRMVSLSQITELVPGGVASQINRKDLFREVALTANVHGRPNIQTGPIDGGSSAANFA